MATSAGDSHEYPVYGYHNRLTFPIFDADGDLVTGAAALDSEVSKDGGTFADCTNEATELATSSGMYYLDLTGAEMSAKQVAVITKTTTSGAKTAPNVLYPRRLPQLETGTAQAGAAGTITLASGASAKDSFYNGLFVGITNDTPSGAQYQLRRVVSYVGSTRVATIESNWGTNPSSSSTYEILIPEGSNVAAWAGVKVVDPGAAGEPTTNPAHWKDGVIPAPNVTGEPLVDLNHWRGTQPSTLNNNLVQSDVERWLNGVIPAPSVTGVPKVDLVDWLGSAPDALSSGKVPADLKLWLAAAPAALSTNGYVQAMLLRWLTDNAGGTPNALQSGRVDGYLGAVASGVIAAGSFASGALDAVWSTATRTLSAFSFTVSANLVQILGTALTETVAGYLAAGFKKLHDVAAPVFTLASVNQTGDNYARLGAPAGASIAADLAEIEAETDAIATLNNLSQADVRAAVGLASANLDTQLAEIEAETDGIVDIQSRIPAALTPAGNIKADVEQWRASTPNVLQSGRVEADVEAWLGTNVESPATPGIPLVEAEHKYAARVRVVRDDEGATDRYEVVWLKDNEVWAGTVTTPKIQVMKESDGSDLIVYQALPISPALGFLYEAAGAELQADGEGYVVYVDATIDGLSRQDWIPVGVDTSSNVVDANVVLWRDSAPNMLQGGRVDGYVGAVAAGVIAAASFAAGALDAVWSTAARTLTSGANIVLTKGVGLLGLNDLSSADVTASVPTAAANADAVWDEALSGHLGAGSTGEALEAAGSAGDPWATALPGAYGAGTAGKIVGDNLDTPVSSRLATSGYTAPSNASIAAIKAKTDQFVFTNAGKVDAAVLAAGDFAQAAADKVWSTTARTLTSFGTLAADVWAVATRTLTSGAGIVLTKGTGLLGLNDPSANANADALLDRADAIETGWTPRKALRLMASVLAGKTTGGHTTTIHFRDLNDSKDRIVAVTDRDATGSDRTSVTLDGS